MQHMKTLYNLTKTICNDKPRQSTVVNDRNSNALTGDEDTRKRWREHFMEILKREEPAYPVNEEDCEQQGIADIYTGPVSKAEIRRAIKSLKNGKAPGEDMITSELLKADLERYVEVILYISRHCVSEKIKKRAVNSFFFFPADLPTFTREKAMENKTLYTFYLTLRRSG